MPGCCLGRRRLGTTWFSCFFLLRAPTDRRKDDPTSRDGAPATATGPCRHEARLPNEYSAALSNTNRRCSTDPPNPTSRAIDRPADPDSPSLRSVPERRDGPPIAANPQAEPSRSLRVRSDRSVARSMPEVFGQVRRAPSIAPLVPRIGSGPPGQTPARQAPSATGTARPGAGDLSPDAADLGPRRCRPGPRRRARGSRRCIRGSRRCVRGSRRRRPGPRRSRQGSRRRARGSRNCNSV